MKLQVDDIPQEVRAEHDVCVGDVFLKAGNEPGYWMVVSIRPSAKGYRDQSCYVLAFDLNGEVTGCQHYGVGYFSERIQRRVGRAQLPSFFEVEWIRGCRS